MSNYTKSTNFATKDNLTPGDPLKIVRGTEIDTEFNNIATAIATKTDNASAALTGGTINDTTIGATTASTGAFTTLAASGNVTLSGGTANGVAYLNGSKVVTSGSALTFDGANIIVNATTPAYFTGTSNLAQVSINRSPSTGAIFNASQSAAYLNIDGASGGSSFQFVVASAANTQPSEQMRLNSTGLGIGTSSPSQKLEVAGNMYINTSGNPYLQIKTSGAGNNPYIRMQADTNYWDIQSTFSNTNDDLLFQYNGTALLDLDKNGNLGLGVTPSAWDASGAGGPVLQIKRGLLFGADTETRLIHNAYYGTGDFRYIATGVAATNYQQQSGQHRWYNAPSGTAGNAITFTQAMTLDASGNLLIGTTTATGANLDVYESGSGDATIRVGNAQNGFTNSFGKQGGTAYGANAIGDGFVYSDSSLSIMADNGTGVIKFSAGGNTERARIDSSGNLSVGITSVTASNAKSWFFDVQQGYQSINHSTANTSGNYFSGFAYNGSYIGSIAQSGTTAVAYNTSSDYRLKNTIAPMTGALAKVAQLKPVTYKWNADGSDGEGFIAHELAEVCPHAVTGEKDAVDENGNPKYQGIDTSFLVATLTAAIQEQQAIIESLKARLDAANL